MCKAVVVWAFQKHMPFSQTEVASCDFIHSDTCQDGWSAWHVRWGVAKRPQLLYLGVREVGKIFVPMQNRLILRESNWCFSELLPGLRTPFDNFSSACLSDASSYLSWQGDDNLYRIKKGCSDGVEGGFDMFWYALRMRKVAKLVHDLPRHVAL